MNVSQSAKELFYDYILDYEKNISSHYGEYDLDNKNLQKFFKERGIFIAGGLGKNNRKKAKSSTQYILYTNTKPGNKPKNDYACNILRHIRNSMAHGNLDKKSKNDKSYILKDYDKNHEESMDGRILVADFEKLLNLLKATRTTNG